MSQFSSQSSLFIKQTLTFENKNINIQEIPNSIIDSKFGILNLQSISTPLSQKEHDFIFMVDCSGSMSDKCSDGRSKMQHIIHTLKNIILYFKENNNIKVNITINAFDDKIYNILKRTNITNDNINIINDMIDKIVPRGSTNIELAINHVNETVNNIQANNIISNINHIFMTDGDATAGNTNPSFLSNLVNKNIDNNAFIGFGIDHDANLLNHISDHDNSSYYFIDKLENSGLIYGEILHGVLYKLLTNVEITIKNGLIYDFKKNIWCESLNIREIIGEADKIYHVISSNTAECSANLKAKHVITNENINITIFKQEDADLTKYIYRQRTLQHLYIVNDFLKRKNDKKNNRKNDIKNDRKGFTLDISFCSSNNYNNKDLIVFEEEENLIKQGLKKFIEEIKTYISVNNLNDDKFLKNLCDDIYISYKTFGTKFGSMYNYARQTSQGSQRCYTVSQTPNNITEPIHNSKPSYKKQNGFPSPPKLRRYNHSLNNNIDLNFIDQNFIDHEISDFNDTPYLTPSSCNMMREINKNL